jgi:cyclopropane fatty-acyl-phospholipid synthase-like methyltransferase
MVEVGAGWGYLLMLAAQKYGAEVTAHGPVGSQNECIRTCRDAEAVPPAVATSKPD